jgi:hypothetical protein
MWIEKYLKIVCNEVELQEIFMKYVHNSIIKGNLNN